MRRLMVVFCRQSDNCALHHIPRPVYSFPTLLLKLTRLMRPTLTLTALDLICQRSCLVPLDGDTKQSTAAVKVFERTV